MRKSGFNLKLNLIGGGKGKPKELVEKQVIKSDPQNKFVMQRPFLPKDKIIELMRDSHIFIFASSCENMPITLLEGMAAGLPIACSNSGPMPEVLEDGGVYFDPLNPESIAMAIEKIILNSELRHMIAKRAKIIANKYSWERCSQETFEFICNTFFEVHK